MLGDGAMTSAMASWWRKAWPGETGRRSPKVTDASFAETVADFSRQLGERAAERAAAGPITTAQERQEAMRAYDRARRRKQVLVGAFVGGGLIALAIASLAPPSGDAPGLPPTGIAAAAEPAPQAVAPVTTAATVEPPAPASPAPTSPVQNASLTDVPVATASQPASDAAPGPQPLKADEVREVQRKLRAFGFDPGPIDGTTGRRTATAVMRYQESRNLPQTGDVDSDLLEMLRQDRAPEVVPPPPPPRPQYHTRTAARQENPFQRLGRWIDSLVR
ncbi:MAG: peptidoglycan-binding protein [Reyranella sp.]|nr:peptidoglycan-binding protein [Reyranella sp.]